MGLSDFFRGLFGPGAPFGPQDAPQESPVVAAAPPPDLTEWNRTWEDQIKWLAYPFDLIPEAEAEAAFLAAQERGRIEGFSPLVLAPGMNLVPNMPRERLVAAAQDILARVRPAAEYFEERGRGSEDDEDVGLFDHLQPREPSAGGSDMNTPGCAFVSAIEGFPKHGEVALVRVPTPNSWEIPAYFLFGGWNFIATPEQMVAVAKYWHERWGAEICGICQESLEFRVARKPTGHKEAVALLHEHYLFCSEMELDEDGLEEMAADLRVMDYWFFWWD
jgi:Domain of unknown function (DUF4253)